MGFQEVQTLDADKTITIGGKDKKTGKTNPKELEGYFLGSRTVQGNGKYANKPSTLYFLQTKDGNTGVWGKTDLNRKLSGVVPGTMIKIVYQGMVSVPNGEMHKYKVFQDKNNTIDVSEISTAGEETGSDESENDIEQGDLADSGGYDSSDDDTDDYEEEVVAAPVRKTTPSSVNASAAERKAKVEALLNKTGNRPKA
jgi:hypothetical protein